MAKILRVVALASIIAFSIAAAIVGGILGIIIASTYNNQATAQMMENQTVMENPDFDARLIGASEVPPVQTNASGFADLDVESEDGPIIVPLFNASATPTGPVTGQLAEGHITAANFEGPLQGKQLDDLIALMQNGTTYVNVHTEQNPQGEIRGTVLLDDSAYEGEEDDFEDDDEGEGEEEEEEEDDNG